ncbi:MAG: winged helix-turn-helix domain-containing protein [Candidatus Zixiibacteriota bacterium]
MNSKTRQEIIIFKDSIQSSDTETSYLNHLGCECKIEPLDGRISEIINIAEPAMLIFDITTSGADCMKLCREIRAGFAGPVLIISPGHDVIDEVAAYECGADGYLTKPVEMRLLQACIKNLMRRFPADNNHNGPMGSGAPVKHFISLGSLEVDGLKRRVTINDREIMLTTAEFDLLWLLASHPNEIVTRDQIYITLRHIEYDGLDRSIDLRIARLRKKIGDTARNPRYIKTIRSTGYLLVSD